MAKALFCLECGAIKSFPWNGDTAKCDCAEGQVVGWWLEGWTDMRTAEVQMAVLPPGNQGKARVLLIHTGFLRAEVETMPTGYVGPDGQLHPFDQAQIDANWRDQHQQVIMTPPRPESLSVFHPSRRGCPLAILHPGTSPDTHWATDVELHQRGLLEPAPV